LLSASLPPTRAATRHGPRSPWSKDWNRLLWKNDAPGTLARLKTAMTPAELAAMLSLSGPAVTAAEVGDVLAAHPAFTRGGEDGFFISRPADVRAITGGMQPADPAAGTVLGTAAHGAGPVFTQRLPQPAAL
jgi:hypothetical protein